MIKVPIFAALMLAAPGLGAKPADDRTPAAGIDKTAKGIKAQIEDDLANSGDWDFKGIRTSGCTSVVRANRIRGGRNAARQPGRWTVDWTTAETAAMQFNFIHIAAPGVKFNIVTDGTPKQMARLTRLDAAMQSKMLACQYNK